MSNKNSQFVTKVAKIVISLMVIFVVAGVITLNIDDAVQAMMWPMGDIEKAALQFMIAGAISMLLIIVAVIVGRKHLQL